MKALGLELRKEKRTGTIVVLPIVGVIGAAYAFVNYIIRKDTLLSLPLKPMDVLLTQLYGMILILNLFGIIVTACIIYNMEFKESAIKRMYTLPISITNIYLCKILVISSMLFLAVTMENIALAKIGRTYLPHGSFEPGTLIRFSSYSFLTSMPVLTLMMLISSCFENMWVPLGVGVAGFLTGMALAPNEISALMVHPFVLMLKPAVSLSAEPDMQVVMFALVETVILFSLGFCMSKKRYE